ncbi:unnamed protein product [Leuciscus chuanchicus]
MDSKRQKICKKTHVNSGIEVREDGEEMITDANRDTTSHHDLRTETENSDTTTHQTLQDTGSVCVKIRSSRAAAVCLVLLCVLQLTAVIVLCVELSKIIDQFNIKLVYTKTQQCRSILFTLVMDTIIRDLEQGVP